MHTQHAKVLNNSRAGRVKSLQTAVLRAPHSVYTPGSVAALTWGSRHSRKRIRDREADMEKVLESNVRGYERKVKIIFLKKNM